MQLKTQLLKIVSILWLISTLHPIQVSYPKFKGNLFGFIQLTWAEIPWGKKIDTKSILPLKLKVLYVTKSSKNAKGNAIIVIVQWQ